MTDSPTPTVREAPPRALGWRRRVGRAAVRLLLAMAAFLVIYALFLLVGLWPVNRGYAPRANGVEVFVLEDPAHTDLILPIASGDHDWRELIPAAAFPAPAPWATHYAIGWGDRGFYLNTPTWADLKASTACHAMFWPSRTMMHVSATTAPGAASGARRLALSPEAYGRLCEEIAASFAGGGRPRQIDFAYGRFDTFYEAKGAYHCFYTCNSWAGDRLKSAGASTPLFTPLPGMVGMYLPP